MKLNEVVGAIGNKFIKIDKPEEKPVFKGSTPLKGLRQQPLKDEFKINKQG